MMLFPVKDLEQAIALVNDIPFGLGASKLSYSV